MCWELAPSHPIPAVRCEPGTLAFSGALFALLRVEVMPSSSDPGGPSCPGAPSLLDGDLPVASGFRAGAGQQLGGCRSNFTSFLTVHLRNARQ